MKYLWEYIEPYLNYTLSAHRINQIVTNFGYDDKGITLCGYAKTNIYFIIIGQIIIHQVEELVEEIINIEHHRTSKKRPKLKMANANSSSSMTLSLAFGLLIASLHI